MSLNHKTYTIEEAKRSAEKYCAYQERCHKEVVDKLHKMGMISIAIDEIVTHLIQHNFLNESRFAKAYAGGKFRTKSWGRVRITQELKKRGLNDRLIKEGLSEISDEDYEIVLDKLSRKRLKELSREKDKWRKRKKFVDYLLYRGWEPELVYEKMNELMS